MKAKEKETAEITVQNVKTYSVSAEVRNDIKESLIHLLRSDQELMKDIFRCALVQQEESFTLKQDDEIQLVKPEKEDAKKMIQGFIEENPGCLTSDIIFNLKLDVDLVMENLKELKNEELVEGKDIE